MVLNILKNMRSLGEGIRYSKAIAVNKKKEISACIQTWAAVVAVYNEFPLLFAAAFLLPLEEQSSADARAFESAAPFVLPRYRVYATARATSTTAAPTAGATTLVEGEGADVPGCRGAQAVPNSSPLPVKVPGVAFLGTLHVWWLPGIVGT